VIKRSTLLTDGSEIEVKSLPFEISNFQKLQFDDKPAEQVLPNIPQAVTDDLGNKLKSTNITAEYEVIMDALKQANFNKSKAAQLLNIDRKTLYNKLNQYKELMKEQ
jgi:two-component system response regulator HydG